MPDKDELKKKKKLRPRKRKSEEEGIDRQNRNTPIYVGGFVSRRDERPPLMPEEQRKPENTGLLAPLPKIDKDAFVDELPSELDMALMYVDELMRNANFGFATLSVLRYVLANEMGKDRQRTLLAVSDNSEEINRLLEKIAYGRYDDDFIVTSANQIINMVSENPDEYLEMINEAARYDYESITGLSNEYK